MDRKLLTDYLKSRVEAIKNPRQILDEQSAYLNSDPIGYMMGFAGGTIKKVGDLPRTFTTKPMGQVVEGLEVYKSHPELKDITVTYGQDAPRYNPGGGGQGGEPWYIRRGDRSRETVNVNPGDDTKAALFDGLLAALRARGVK